MPNDPLAAVAQKNLQEVGGYKMDAEQQKFALELQKTFKMDNVPEPRHDQRVEPLRKFDPNEPAASTDVGDVSWNVPTIGFSTATLVPAPQPTPGRPPHSRHEHRAAGYGGRGEGAGPHRARSVHRPALVQAAKADFAKQTAGKSYYTAIPADQKPPLNYRNE